MLQDNHQYNIQQLTEYCKVDISKYVLFFIINSLIEISRSNYIINFWILILQLSCLGSEFQQYSMDCEFQ